MKTNPATQAPALTQTEPLPQLIAATANALPEQVDALARARAFAEPLLACETLDSGENTLVHADAVAAIQARPPFAVAVNTSFVPNTRYAAHALQPGDRVEIISPVTGG